MKYRALDMHIRTRCVWIMTMHFRKKSPSHYKHFLVKTLYFDSGVFYVRGYNPKAFSRNICSRLKFYVQDHISLLRHKCSTKKGGPLQFQKFSNLWLVYCCTMCIYPFIVVLTYCRSISEYYMELWSRKSCISCNNVGIMGGLIHHLAQSHSVVYQISEVPDSTW